MNTIVAVATPPGRSAIGVIRLSGPESVDILRALCREPEFTPGPAKILLKHIYREPGEPLDSVLVSFFEAPRSFTGEDVVEISCHGSPVILRQVLDLSQSLGARLAGPGEFTERACRNGKMNLSQAEAIRDLINAQTDAAAVQAARQLNGELSNALKPAKQLLIDIIVRLESALEFVEDDLPEVQTAEIKRRLTEVLRIINALTRTYATGHLLRDGIKTAIVGRPNVGKSSLFNRLLGLDRAIVTDIPGTTRDSISEPLTLGGVPIFLSDTAGIRSAGDKIEAIGVERTRQAMADADLLIAVIDGSVDPSLEDMAVISQATQARHLVVINKCDLPISPKLKEPLDQLSSAVHVSALTGEGLVNLSAAILNAFVGADSEGVGLLVTNSRHHELLRRTEHSVSQALEELSSSASEELVLVGLHNALGFLGEITGETTSGDILAQIFSTFCIGK